MKFLQDAFNFAKAIPSYVGSFFSGLFGSFRKALRNPNPIRDTIFLTPRERKVKEAELKELREYNALLREKAKLKKEGKNDVSFGARIGGLIFCGLRRSLSNPTMPREDREKLTELMKPRFIRNPFN